MGALNQGFEVGQGAEHRVDVAVVADVVAKVLHRALEKGREPDAVGTKFGNVLQPGGDAGQVADAIGIAVLVGAWINLVDDAAAPPVVVGCFVHEGSWMRLSL